MHEDKLCRLQEPIKLQRLRCLQYSQRSIARYTTALTRAGMPPSNAEGNKVNILPCGRGPQHPGPKGCLCLLPTTTCCSSAGPMCLAACFRPSNSLATPLLTICTSWRVVSSSSPCAGRPWRLRSSRRRRRKEGEVVMTEAGGGGGGAARTHTHTHVRRPLPAPPRPQGPAHTPTNQPLQGAGPAALVAGSAMCVWACAVLNSVLLVST